MTTNSIIKRKGMEFICKLPDINEDDVVMLLYDGNIMKINPNEPAKRLVMGEDDKWVESSL